MKTILYIILLVSILTGATFGQKPSNSLSPLADGIAAKPGEVVRVRRAFQKAADTIVFNLNDTAADVDVSVFDENDIEIGRESVIIAPQSRERIDAKSLMSDFGDRTPAHVILQISVRPNDSDPGDWAVQLPIAFFSQRDARWSANKLGTCRSDTIKSSGCAITAIASALSSIVTDMNPASLNTYLTNNSGYSGGCNVIWSKAADIDGRFGATYVGSGTVSSVSNLKNLIDNRKFAVVSSSRFASHWALIIGYRNSGTKLSDFYYVDPYDTSATFRNVGDGWVSTKSATRIYQ